MLFNSPSFIFGFLPAVLAGFFVLGRYGSPRLAILWLGFASLVFYGFDNPRLQLPLILVSITFNFLVGRALARTGRRALLVTGVVGNLLLLGFFKYAGLLRRHGRRPDRPRRCRAPTSRCRSASRSTRSRRSRSWSTSIAAARRNMRRSKYLLFVTFFPHLIAGPILHHRETIPQFDRKELLQAAGRLHRARARLVRARPVQEGHAGRQHRAVLGRGVRRRRQGRGCQLRRRLDRRAQLHAADLFRLLRLFRHGDRAGAAVRHHLSAELQLALQVALADRLLAALAHDAVALPARLSLCAARRQPARAAAPLHQPARHHGDRRPVARRKLEFRGLGRDPRHRPRRQSSVAQRCRETRARAAGRRRPHPDACWWSCSPGCRSAQRALLRP